MLALVIPALLRWTHRKLPARARRRLDTGDLVQEALVGVLQHMPDLERRAPGDVEAYVIQSIRNRIRDEIRRSGLGEVAGAAKTDARASGEPSPLERAIESDHQRKFEWALAQLEPDERELVIGRVELDLSYDELAAALGKPSTDAARVATRRAMLKLARVLGEG